MIFKVPVVSLWSEISTNLGWLPLREHDSHTGVFNPALTIPDQKSPWATLGKNSQNLGTAIPAIESAGLNAPAYWDGIK